MGDMPGGDRFYAEANRAAGESILAVRVVQSYNMQSEVLRRYRTMLDAYHGKVGKGKMAVLRSGGGWGGPMPAA